MAFPPAGSLPRTDSYHTGSRIGTTQLSARVLRAHIAGDPSDVQFCLFCHLASKSQLEKVCDAASVEMLCSLLSGRHSVRQPACKGMLVLFYSPKNLWKLAVDFFGSTGLFLHRDSAAARAYLRPLHAAKLLADEVEHQLKQVPPRLASSRLVSLRFPLAPPLLTRKAHHPRAQASAHASFPAPPTRPVPCQTQNCSFVLWAAPAPVLHRQRAYGRRAESGLRRSRRGRSRLEKGT